MSLKDRFIGKRFLQPFFERLYRISLRGMNYGLAAYVESSGELHILTLLKQFYGDKELVILDVGANTGQYLSYLKNTFDHAKIHSFEPAAKPYETLKQHESDHVSLHPFALSSSAGSSDLYYDVEGTGWASMAPRKYEHLGVTLDKKETIETRTMDWFCQEHQIDKVHFCKMDIEGFELEALKGGADLIQSGNLEFIQFEFGLAAIETKVFLKDFFDFLSEYRIYRILQDGIYEIQYNERYEVYLNSNYLAVHKSVPFEAR